MNLSFSHQTPLHSFQVSGILEPRDLQVLKHALMRMLDDSNLTIIVNLSDATLAPNLNTAIYDQTLKELSIMANASGNQLSFIPINSDETQTPNPLIEAIEKKQKILQTKKLIRSEMKNIAEQLLTENHTLKEELEKRINQERKQPKQKVSILSRFWSSK